MYNHKLSGRRILVVEDEYMLAEDLRSELSNLGAVVLGPVGTVANAFDLIASEADIDGAILDVNLAGEKVFAVADRLIARDIPLVFATGYDASAIPQIYSDVPRCEKPVNISKISAALSRLIRLGAS